MVNVLFGRVVWKCLFGMLARRVCLILFDVSILLDGLPISVGGSFVC